MIILYHNLFIYFYFFFFFNITMSMMCIMLYHRQLFHFLSEIHRFCFLYFFLFHFCLSTTNNQLLLSFIWLLSLCAMHNRRMKTILSCLLMMLHHSIAPIDFIQCIWMTKWNIKRNENKISNSMSMFFYWW